MQFLKLKVVGLNAETTDVVTVAFKQPGLKKIKYKAGQYLTVIFRINGRRYIRPYSFSSAFGIDENLEITIKRVPGGVVSNHIIDTLKVGDFVEVMPPMGDFVLHEDNINKDTHIVLWGAGSGITPLMSIAKNALHHNLSYRVTLVYGNRTEEDVIFSNNISLLNKQFPENFRSIHFFTRQIISVDNPNIIEGRIDPKSVMRVMQNEGEISNSIHYICGPAGLKESIKQELKTLNFKSDRIYTEDFELIRNPADFEDIIGREVIIDHDGKSTLVEVIKGKSILEAGLDALIELPYSCQIGSCMMCKAKVLKGRVKMLGLKDNSHKLDEEECLLCCSFPLTNDIQIKTE